MDREVIISPKQINRFAFILVIVIIAGFYLPFAFIWGWQFTWFGLKHLLKELLYWIIPIIILHEGLHGLVWLFASKSIKNIQFGFNRELLAPYTHCKIPLSKFNYILGGLFPFIIMGLIPAIITIIIGNSYWYLFSLFCIFTSGGDIISCFYLMKIKGKFKVQDHPQKLGFILIEV